MTGVIHFLLLALPCRGQLRAQAWVCKFLERCLVGCLGSTTHPAPGISQCLMASAAITLRQASRNFIAELDNDQVTLDFTARSVAWAFKGAIADMPPNPFEQMNFDSPSEQAVEDASQGQKETLQKAITIPVILHERGKQ